MKFKENKNNKWSNNKNSNILDQKEFKIKMLWEFDTFIQHGTIHLFMSLICLVDKPMQESLEE